MALGEGEVEAGAKISVDLPLYYGDYLNIDILAADGVAKRLTSQVRCH